MEAKGQLEGGGEEWRGGDGAKKQVGGQLDGDGLGSRDKALDPPEINLAR